MRRIYGFSFLFIVLSCLLCLFAFATENVVYVCDGGTGDGSSASGPVGTMEGAYEALGDAGGEIVLVGTTTIASKFVAPAHSEKITITAVNNAALEFLANFYCGGDTEFHTITLRNRSTETSSSPYHGIFGMAHDLTLGKNIVSERQEGCNTYLSVIGGSSAAYKNVSTNIVIESGIWQRVRGGANKGGSINYNITITVNGGTFCENFVLASAATSGNNSHSGDVETTISGGTFYGGIFVTAHLLDTDVYEGNVSVTLNGGTVYGMISPAFNKIGSMNGSYMLYVNGGEFAHLTEIGGTATMAGDMTSVLFHDDTVDLYAAETGTVSFDNYIRRNNADPFVFFHDGYYYYTCTGDTKVHLIRAANIADLQTAQAHTILDPVEGQNLWSPEIWYFSADEIGEENAGWYMFVAYDDGTTANQRQYVAKCLDGDNLLGRWGDPVTGEVNVLRKMTFVNGGYNEDELCGGTSVIRIGGKTYLTFVSEIGRGTSAFHQTINITDFENPWTITGTPVEICRPTEPWEMGGYYQSTVEADKWWPQVVEGASAVYAPTGEVYLMYTGSGYWTVDYALGFLRFKGGNPLDASNWEKNTERVIADDDWYKEWESRWYYKDLFTGRGTLYHPVFARVAKADLNETTVNGCGHGSYFTDADGQMWVAYHGYIGTDTSSKRFSFIEPIYVTADGVRIGNGTGHPADLSTVYTCNVNPDSLLDKITDFTETSVKAESTLEQVNIRFTPVEGATAYAIYLGETLLGTTDTLTFSDTTARPGKHLYTVRAMRGEEIISTGIVSASAYQNLRYKDLNGDGKIDLSDALMLLRGHMLGEYPDATLLDVLQMLRCL